jgi:DNA-binding NtrC family response regulator
MSGKILIVDDEVLIQWFIEKAVTNWGYHAEAVGSVVEALQCLDARDYDVMITDIIMPGANGYDLIVKVRESNKDMGIIACSAFFSADLIDELTGINVATLKKPFRQKELKEILENVIDSRSASISM